MFSVIPTTHRHRDLRTFPRPWPEMAPSWLRARTQPLREPLPQRQAHATPRSARVVLHGRTRGDLRRGLPRGGRGSFPRRARRPRTGPPPRLPRPGNLRARLQVARVSVTEAQVSAPSLRLAHAAATGPAAAHDEHVALPAQGAAESDPEAQRGGDTCRGAVPHVVAPPARRGAVRHQSLERWRGPIGGAAKPTRCAVRLAEGAGGVRRGRRSGREKDGGDDGGDEADAGEQAQGGDEGAAGASRVLFRIAGGGISLC